MRKTVLFLLIFSLLGAAGCTDVLKKKQEVGAMENEVNLTQEKKDFLTAMSMDEERIQNGDLYDWQVEVLRQYDYVEEYLKGKYPSHTFVLNSCNPKGRDNSFSTFWFTADDGEESYELYLYVDSDDHYSCEDNYYGTLLKDSYNTALLSLLQEEIPECIGAASIFSNVQGENVGEKVTGKEVLDGDMEIPNTVYIYAVSSEASQAQTLVEKVEQLIQEKKIYGNYYIKVLNSDPGRSYSGDELRDYVRKNGSQLVVLEQSFNQGIS